MGFSGTDKILILPSVFFKKLLLVAQVWNQRMYILGSPLVQD